MKKHPLALGGFFLVLLSFYLGFVHHTDTTEMGVRFNYVTGIIESDSSGWHITAPWVKVAKIDLRPSRVCVESAGQGYNCRLVRFVPEQYLKFVDTQGFHYWWWANRISFNMGYRSESRGMHDLMRGYTYSTRPYPFVEIMDEPKR